MTTLLGEFKAITEALNTAGIEYAVCGGWAMAIHGFARATKDIDLLILSKNLDGVLGNLRRFGYDVEIRRVSKLGGEPKRLITVDLLLVNDLMKEIWQGRKTEKWYEGSTSVVSREGLIKMKLLAGRKQDLLDIEILREAENEG